jgi:hypothetical protein
MTVSMKDDRRYYALGAWISLVTFADPSGGMIDLPVGFLLKNGLHLDAGGVARFRLAASLPFFAAILFGLARDAFHSSGLTDKRLTAAFGLLGMICYGAFACLPVTVGSMLAATLLATCFFQMIASAQSGLSAEIGRRYNVTGQISALWNVCASLAASLAFYAGGMVSESLERMPIADAGRAFYVVCALLSAAICAFAVVDPGGVFEAIEPRTRTQSARGMRAVVTGLRPALPALAIWFVWNFAPGSSTPLQFYVQNELGATNAQWGLWNAIFSASFIPTLALYGHFSKRMEFSRLLYRAALVSAPQFVPLLFVNTLNEALVAAALIGMLGGFATGAYLDLIIRSCSPGFEGTTLMMAGGLYYIATRLGDVVGAYLYDWSGDFTVCVALMTVMYSSILIILRGSASDVIGAR